MKKTFLTIVAILTVALAFSAGARAQGDAWSKLGNPGTHILMRHAEAPGVGDPPNFRIGDCSTQRNLSEQGRDQARRIGQAIRDRGIRIERVLSSQWCRAAQTASLLGLGAAVEYPALNSFFSVQDTAGKQSREVSRKLAALDKLGERAILVTHQVNITALTGVFPASGEMIVVRVAGEGVRVLGRVPPSQATAQ
ncbi:histidine phosphatase family protein [Terrihabitans rhizophilus]|uniref:Histidine phosphatase family protein n=1 Tax=Terrihabitans rhizophilus TaxID=3092662 RepID=A0ABU4RPH9_9HYPH|nr:histidine phosphatase family protein [Terrihabitans sp. PJ23]MDX6806750.1 histidine phosphatase family protein [Terrihabitans sp. PJ23]